MTVSQWMDLLTGMALGIGLMIGMLLVCWKHWEQTTARTFGVSYAYCNARDSSYEMPGFRQDHARGVVSAGISDCLSLSSGFRYSGEVVGAGGAEGALGTRILVEQVCKSLTS